MGAPVVNIVTVHQWRNFSFTRLCVSETFRVYDSSQREPVRRSGDSRARRRR